MDVLCFPVMLKVVKNLLLIAIGLSSFVILRMTFSVVYSLFITALSALFLVN